MRMENGMLFVVLHNAETAVPLPALDRAAQIKAWAVPADYRADGLFVAITERGDAEQVPACNLSECQFLGELELPADAALQLQAAKQAKLGAVNADCDAAAAKLAAAYPQAEILSWPQQAREAAALASDAQAPAPLLEAIAQNRGVTLSELARRVLDNMQAFSAESGAIIGRRQAARVKIDAAETLEELMAISF